MARPRSDEADPVVERLDVMIKLLAGSLTRGMSRKDAVLALSASGLAPKEVAAILGLSGQQVSVVLYDAKQAAAKSTKAPPRKA